ncbi:hypothetical protein GGF46_003875 [Coemansia sp. RSA 552]|nr:hypothetical protein GGF46_003875 [Coemansia sp. RSA 552]
MIELESAVASVRSSLDNHASSYYSVASQIADRQTLHVADEPEGLVQAHSTTNTGLGQPGAGAKGNETDNDDQYARIQEMIDSLIKDADSALNSRPGGIRRRLLSEDLVDAPAADEDSVEPMAVDYSEPDELATLVAGRSSRCSSRLELSAQPRSRGAEYSLHTPGPRPSTAMGIYVKSARSRRHRARTIVPRHELSQDPTEADAESESEAGPPNTPLSRQRAQRGDDSNYLRDRPASSRAYRRRRASSGQHSDWHSRTTYRLGRYRSDTLESRFSNSSETCVSPGNRVSREFGFVPMQPPATVATPGFPEAASTPPRLACSGFPGGKDELPSSAHSLPPGPTCSFPHLGADDGRRQQLRRLPSYDRDQAIHGHFARYQGHPAPQFHSRVSQGSSEDISREYITREAVHAHCSPRIQGGAYVHEHVHEPPVVAAIPTSTYSSTPCSRLHADARRDATATPWDPCACPGAPASQSSPMAHGSPQMRSQHQGPLEANEDSGCRSERALSVTKRPTTEHGEVARTSDGSSAGLLNVFSLLYWTLLFTLGALMLDSFLCHTAGKRVMGTVDKIAHVDGNARQIGYSGTSESEEDVEETTLANTVGRLVRWYVEGADDASLAGGRSSGRAQAHPRSLRARKASAMRGSFKYVG